MYQMCPYGFCDRDTITFMFIRRNEDLNTQQRSSEESRRLATSLKLSQIEPFVKIEVVVVNLLEEIFTEFIFLSFSSTSTTWVISFMELFLLASFSSPFVMKPSLNSYNPFYQPTFNLFSMCANILYSSNILFGPFSIRGSQPVFVNCLECLFTEDWKLHELLNFDLSTFGPR